MATLQGYEIIDQTAFRIRSVRKAKPILGAEYGAGYADYVGVGPAVKEFVAVAGIWPDDSFYGTIGGEPWMTYYWDFLHDRLENDNEPFVIFWREAYWLVSMADPETSVECLRCENSDLFVPQQITLKYRRVVGVELNADGSMVEP